MTCKKVYLLLKELRCATALEVATRLGASRKVAQMCLNNLVTRGVVEKRVLGRRAVIYCVVEGVTVNSPLNERRNSGRRSRVVQGGYRLYTATRERLAQVLEMLQRGGCISVGALMRVLGVSHTKAYHVLRVALLLRVGVKVRIGRTAVLCRDRAVAEEAVARIRETIHRLAAENGMKYVTAPKVLQAVLRDRDAYELLSRFIPLRRGAARFPPVVLTFIGDVLQSLYGEPLRRRNGRVYVVTPHPRSYTPDATDSADKHVVRVNLPEDLAAALQEQDADQVVLQAIEQLLARYR